MPQNNKAKDYLQEVCSHIRWKRAREIVRKELEAHIEDQQEAFIVSGMNEPDAASLAVEEMGDAAVVGSLLDRSYRPKPAWNVIAITAALMIIGYFSRLYIISENRTYYTVQPVQSLLWLAAAVAALIIAYFLDFTMLVKYGRTVRAAYYAILSLMVLSVFFGGYPYIISRYGEYFLFLFPVIYPGILCSVKSKGYIGFLGCCSYLAVFVFCGFVIPSFMTGLVCWFIGLVLLTFAVVKGFFKINKILGVLMIYLPPASFFAWVSINTHYLHRFWAIFVSEGVAAHIGQVNVDVREILRSAKMLGTGGYAAENISLPNFVSDFALTFFTHKFGWFSFIAVAALFVLLFIILFSYILKQKNRLGQMVSISVFLVLLAEFAVYIMNNLGFGFFGSMSLPLVSQGNPELIINSFLIGLLLSVFRTGDLVGSPNTESAAYNTVLQPKQ